MKNRYLFLIICLCLTGLAYRCSSPTDEAVKPVIQNTGTSQITIAWSSRKPYVGKVFYKPAGTDAGMSPVKETFGETQEHEITITGLKPATRYTYRIGEKGKQYRFQTQPPVNKPFSFIMLYGDAAQNATHLLNAEVPDFFLSLTPAPTDTPDPFAGVRAYVPVFKRQPGLTRKLDWGGLRLILLDSTEKLTALLDTPSPHTFGILTSPRLVNAYNDSQTVDDDSIRASELHTALIAHNEQHPTKPASFVAIPGSKDDALEVDGIQYMGIPVEKETGPAAAKAIRIDIDVENARAVFTDDQKEIVLRKAPLEGKRTCLECRRLADKGAYEESINAYKDFVENNKGHYQIDDAYFAVAEIYDGKLFRFPEAVKWYRRLANEYPTGTLAALAKQRIAYLARYSDFDYKPLQTFERIRKIDYARKKDQPTEQAALLEQVENLLHEYPDCNLAPMMVHWLANRFRQTSPQKALQFYRTLEEKYPGSDESENVPIEIGETYYGAGLYKEALNAYENALKKLPHREKIIAPQIKRTKRNMLRDTLSIVALAAVLVLIVLTFLLKPMGFYLKGGFYLTAFVVMGLLLLFGGWLIHEQFPSNLQLVLFALLFAFNAALSAALSTNFSGKLFGPQPRGTGRKTAKIVTGSLMGILFFAAGFYLIVYYVSVHFLVLFKL